MCGGVRALNESMIDEEYECDAFLIEVRIGGVAVDRHTALTRRVLNVQQLACNLCTVEDAYVVEHAAARVCVDVR